jgi:hypothetical protein
MQPLKVLVTAKTAMSFFMPDSCSAAATRGIEISVGMLSMYGSL